ncbi:hypothetical protein AHMF7605_06840 [Adhaeribacter arboris]|uniref:N-acetyltransferase domain-containing protein n=1 Tax=Adhaeribacter arboris TaxID=2072846 RepID=A0A2T2YCQ2_9BACT|nr:hypothetical protein [Adhaeribacter arboris]PSR53266.1 hypothetical protein AHMF7605_06840 [Adhaeribacter arboris]
MEIQYSSLAKPTGLDRFYYLLNGEEQIGYVEGHLNNYGELVPVVQIYSGYQRLGLGFEAFKKVFDELNELSPITKILGSWHKGREFAHCKDGMSSNLRIFLNCRSQHNSDSECALQTPTGKWAAKLGFNKCKVLSISSDEVNVEFFK